jgi:hypothetical protein
MAAAELSDDMMSIKKNTLTILTPDRTFREGAYVIFRKGVYFLCGRKMTPAAQLQMRYGTSTSPMDPFRYRKTTL